MTQTIMYFLRIALWGSLVSLAVLALRPLIKKNSNRIMRFLWVIVMVRFLCPFAIEGPIKVNWPSFEEETFDLNREETLKENPFATENVSNSYVNASDAETDAAIALQGTPVLTKTEAQNETPKAFNENSAGSVVEKSGIESVAMGNSALDASTSERVMAKPVAEKTTEKESINSILPLVFSIFGVTWLLGAVLLLIAGAIRYIKISRSLNEAVFLARWTKYPVRTSDISGVPMSFGICRPGIYVPFCFAEGDREDMPFSDKQKKMILWHESMHLKHHDPLMKMAAFVMLALHWWNPLVWLCVHCMNKDIEMACDEAVLAKIGRRNRTEYAETLFRFASRQSGISLMASFGETNAEGRIKNALRYRKAPIGVTVLMMVLVLGLGGCLVFSPTAGNQTVQIEEKEQDAITESAQEDVNAEESLSIDSEKLETEKLISGTESTQEEIKTTLSNMEQASASASGDRDVTSNTAVTSDASVAKNTSDPTDTLVSAENTAMKDTTDNVASSNSADTAMKEDATASSDSLLTKFKIGVGEVYFDNCQYDKCYFGDGEDSLIYDWAKLGQKQGYTLSDLTDFLHENVSEYSQTRPESLFDDLDCGQDGIPEMAVRFYDPDDDGYGTSLTYVLKEVNGKLHATSVFVVSGRESGTLNKSGCYWSAGSIGATTHGYTVGMLDTNGVYHMAYSGEEYLDVSVYLFSGSDLTRQAVNVLMDTYQVEENQIIYITEEIEGKEYEVFAIENVSDEEVYNTLKQAGFEVTSLDELHKLEKAALERYGCTEATKTAEELFNSYF